MIWVLVSTSSPRASVALFDGDRLLSAASEDAPTQAGATSLKLLASVLAEGGIDKKDVDVWAADLGPGSFTGVKVGVTLAKTLAFAFGKQAAGFSSFDLIDLGAVAVPSRKGKLLVRDGEGIAELPDDDPRVLAANRSRPSAEQGGRLYTSMTVVQPDELLPNYVLEPSISVPKAAKP